MGSIPQYDGVLIDESQFFAPIWYEIIRNMIKPQTGNIFIVADPTQGFLNRGVSWRSMGIEVRGRSYELKRSYRTTKEIMTLATVFYRQRVPQDTADEGVLEPEILHMPDGVVTDFIQLQNYQDEIARVTNQVEQFVNQFAIPKSQILIIHADWQGAERLINIINRRLGPNSAKDPRNHDPGDYIRVTNLNRGTGIESPIVFFVGMHLLMEKEQSLRISDEEREKLMLENTRKIYMAMTRAGQRLVITYAGQLPNDIQWMFQ
jgi:superfamily I DNA/RNA helicase